MSPCPDCLGRSRLIGDLAPAIDSAVCGRPAAGREVIGLASADLLTVFGAPEPAGKAATGHREDGDALCRHDPGYPPRLLDLHADSGPPAVLYLSGGCSERLGDQLESPTVTVVGARRASDYGLRTAYALGRGLAAAGVTVVSGLALGIDAAAHQGALDAGGRPLAVVAGGVDFVYPRANRSLREQIAAAGAILSELPPRTPAFPWAFPARNRIMAALGGMTVVVECAVRSGSLITAGCAERMGRTVGAVPGRVDSPLAAGSNALIADGAQVVTGADSVLDELFGVGAGPRPVARDFELTGDLRAVFDLAASGAAADRIAAESDMPPASVRAALGQLELMGLLVRDVLGGHRAA